MYRGSMMQTGITKVYTGASTGTLVTSLVSPLIGLFPAIICSSAKPQESNLDYPSHEQMKDPDYRAGYTQRAKKIKSRKIWTNCGIGFGVNLIAVAVL
ncbi:hypothetical protein [Pontibacter harenae]|uniref:hypothetical protein n=1 Tax=Pontibacter harenae TaxID=2894083 RepID=UPI001E3407B2|nr:hypothetical protein [Pontibacter harenae]MCC9165590.1 hypothetical protein [Pontibacter harenae]